MNLPRRDGNTAGEPGAAPSLPGVARVLGRDWPLQRASWMLLTLLLVAVALGLFGRGGPLSTVSAATADRSLALVYQRNLRYHSPDALQLTLAAGGETAVLRMDLRYAHRIRIEQVLPEPERVVAGPEAVSYVFNTAPGAPTRITIQFSPRHYGRLEGWLAHGEGPRLPLRHFIYP